MMENGIYTDISIGDYHRNTSHISATSIKLAKKSLSLWKWMQTHPQETKLHFDFGNGFELALLDKGNFENQVAILQSTAWAAKAMEEKPELKVPKNSTCYKAEESKFLAANEGKYIIPDTGDQSYQTIEFMLESCY